MNLSLRRATSNAVAWLRLALAPEIGPVLAHRLLQALGSPKEIFAAAPGELLQVVGLGPGRLNGLLDPASLRRARQEAARADELGVRLIPLDDPEYPALLRRLSNPPLVLWMRGKMAPEDRLALAVVGPRQPSSYAKLMVQNLCPPLASKGLCIVSGLAYGIDAAAHRGTLDGGGRTLGVVGQGLGTPIYPQPNAALAKRIVEEERGAIISIFPLQTEPSAGLFPLRNEVIAGLALGTLIIEAAPESGSLITARHAAAHQRVVFACPGDANRRSAQGSNRLLADGAVLVQTPEDVLAALTQEMRHEMQEIEVDDSSNTRDIKVEKINNGLKLQTQIMAGKSASQKQQDPIASRILNFLQEEPLTGDMIMERCAEFDIALPQVLESLLKLELAGTIRQLPGRLYALN